MKTFSSRHSKERCYEFEATPGLEPDISGGSGGKPIAVINDALGSRAGDACNRFRPYISHSFLGFITTNMGKLLY